MIWSEPSGSSSEQRAITQRMKAAASSDLGLVVQIDRVHQLAVDVELKVVEGGVADTDRPRPHVALEVGEGLLAQRVTTVEPVHDLERAVRLELGAACHHPAHEGGRLI